MKTPDYRLIQDDDSHWYVIPVGEERTFYKWCDAMAGKRRIPNNFNPVQVDGPHTIAFGEWKETV